MRRQLKPFVTEYKGSRRASPSLSEPAGLESERPAPKLVETKNSNEAKPRPEPEDSSYEAAMRAADALFAAPAERKPDASPAPNGVELKDHQPTERPEPARSGPADAMPPASNGGRILRVIDEAPPPQFAALEAEFVPKRRGRKPGSKNKPKVLVSDQPREAQAFVSHAFEHHVFELGAPEHPAPVAVPRQGAIPAQRQVVALTEATAAPRGDKRFPWVRDRLKPGEDWKRRRLPRVCW